MDAVGDGEEWFGSGDPVERAVGPFLRLVGDGDGERSTDSGLVERDRVDEPSGPDGPVKLSRDLGNETEIGEYEPGGVGLGDGCGSQDPELVDG